MDAAGTYAAAGFATESIETEPSAAGHPPDHEHIAVADEVHLAGSESAGLPLKGWPPAFRASGRWRAAMPIEKGGVFLRPGVAIPATMSRDW